MSSWERLSIAVTPVFTREMGSRLRIARMRMLIDQSELGRLLGISQRTVCEVEVGKRAVVKSLTLARFKAILGQHSGFVLIGSGSEKYNMGSIKSLYWERFGPGRKKGGSDNKSYVK